MHELSRLSITGPVHERTPLCVLIEIADAHGVSYDTCDKNSPKFAHVIVERIRLTPIPTINQLTTLSEWQYLARFINRNTSKGWVQSDLMQAYNFLILFTNNEDPLNKIPESFTYGSQTPDNCTSINACVLYKTCMQHRLNVGPRTTIKQMACAVRMLRTDVESLSRRVRLFTDKEANRIDLVNILLLSNHEIEDPDPPPVDDISDFTTIPKTEVLHDRLDLLHAHLNNIVEVRARIEPTTNMGAVALAGLNYTLDISYAANAIREYKVLKVSGRDDYRPSDPWMRHWYNVNPTLFDLTVSFNPIFPVIYYDAKRLSDMTQQEGYTSSEISNSSPYELMQLAHVTETFYMGELPNMVSNELAIDIEPISNVPYGELLCYGRLTHVVQPVSMSELIDLFNCNQNFTNPFQRNSVFNAISINKLKLLAQSHVGPIPTRRLSANTLQVRARLLEVIVGVEVFTSANDKPTREFALTYRNSVQEVKSYIIATLTSLLHLGMYMRGWMGIGNDYPVIKAPIPAGAEHLVSVNVTAAIAKFDKLSRRLGPVGIQINNLPLVTYRDGNYQVSTNASDGLTIGERVSIIKQGESVDNVASCIRLSSNWICSSAHKYLMSLGQPAPFDIFNLRHVS